MGGSLSGHEPVWLHVNMVGSMVHGMRCCWIPGEAVTDKPFLVTTDVAATFIVKCKRQEVNAVTLKAARERVYYLAKQGVITRHGIPKRGQSLWDLRELAEPYRQGCTVVLP